MDHLAHLQMPGALVLDELMGLVVAALLAIDG
jgi:hypothetical protein